MNTLTANAKSIMTFSSCGPRGATLTIEAEGEDADDAVATLKSLIDNDFGLAVEPKMSVPPSEIQGIGAAPGIVIGKVFLLIDEA